MRNEKEERVSDLIAPALARVNSKIDYALIAAQGEDESQNVCAIVNVYQTQGIVQTDAHSIANLSNAFAPDENRQLAQALRLARTSLESDPSPESQERIRAYARVTEAEEEIETDQPNHVKLRSMLSADRGNGPGARIGSRRLGSPQGGWCPSGPLFALTRMSTDVACKYKVLWTP